jgi:hypothetical protein
VKIDDYYDNIKMSLKKFREEKKCSDGGLSQDCMQETFHLVEKCHELEKTLEKYHQELSVPNQLPQIDSMTEALLKVFDYLYLLPKSQFSLIDSLHRKKELCSLTYNCGQVRIFIKIS